MNIEEPPQIFISYRRDDSDSEAENILHHLENNFGAVVFKDNFSIKPGDDWAKKIKSGLQTAKVVLVVIGKQWVSMCDENGCRKIDLPDDWVRLEIHTALEEGKIIIPLFINGAKPPTQASFNHPNLTLIRDKFVFQGIKVYTRQLEQDLHKLILEDLPSLGIQPLPTAEKEAAKTEILANYPLPIVPDPGNLPLPYVGLRPFEPNESFLFFGRDQDILKLLKKLESSSPDKKIILYHGQSGVGKSSLLLAGLFLRIKKMDWETPRPRRRKKETGAGPDLCNLMETTDNALKRLFVLDQIEEIFSNPGANPEKEISDFQTALQRFHRECDKAHLLLSFRSDYFTQVRKILDDVDLPWDEQELFPLDREGVLQAITGVTEKPDLQARYNLDFDPPSLPGDIRDDVLQDKNSSHITPLLQYQLEKLFSKAAPADWKTQPVKPALSITAAHYSADFRKENLEKMLDAEFAELRADWETHTVSGLALDVLHQYITDQATADSKKDADIGSMYEHIPDFSAFFDYLKNRRALLIGNRSAEGEAPRARLAHDALAPLLQARFRDSDTPGQRAWQILEPKQKDIKRGFKPTLLAADDLKIIEEGRSGMRAVPLLEGLIAESTTLQQQQDAERRENLAYIFNSFADQGLSLIQSLDHALALKKLAVALDTPIDAATKKAKLQAPFEELLFFFAEGGKRPELAIKAAELLQELQPDAPKLAPLLQQCLHEAWQNRKQFFALLEMLPSCPTLKARYYPEMVAIPGGAFTMGSPETEEPRYADELQHEVVLGTFKLATTPVTFYQYALFCEANQKSIVSLSPSWGRIGDHPLVNINWYDALAFCNWLSVHQGLKPRYTISNEKNSDKNNQVPNDYQKWAVRIHPKANGFRLPSSAEWEFAARGGRKKQSFVYAGSNDLNAVGWYWKNSGDQKTLSGAWENSRVLDNNGRTHPVKEKAENGIGLYDMSGNVYEWCWDWYDAEYYAACKKNEPVNNPQGPESSNSGRVLRGGAWDNYDYYCRVALRSGVGPYSWYGAVGFRLAQD